MLGVLHPVLAHGAPCVGGQELERCGVARGGHDHHGVLHGAGVLEELDGLGDRRVLLADRHVDALHPLPLLVQDGVDGHGGLARLTVTDDELSLPSPDGGHGVDGLDACLERLLHRLPTNDAGCLDLHAAGLRRGQRALAVDRLAECVHHATEHAIAAWHGQDSSGDTDNLLLFESLDRAEDHGTDRILVKVHGQAQGAVLELEQLIDRGARESGDPRDAVGDAQDATDLLGPDLGGVVGDVSLERLGDLIRADRQLCHVGSSIMFRTFSVIGQKGAVVGLEVLSERVETCLR